MNDTPTQSPTRATFFRIMKERYGMESTALQKTPIIHLREGLRLIDKSLSSDKARRDARLELKDIYRMAGIKVHHTGSLLSEF